jgi:hypothetical protein
VHVTSRVIKANTKEKMFWSKISLLILFLLGILFCFLLYFRFYTIGNYLFSFTLLFALFVATLIVIKYIKED